MRVWGRTFNEDGTYQWVAVTTDVNGDSSNCYLTQVNPDFYAQALQQQYAQYFASLTIIRVAGSFPPQYNVRAVCNSGAILNATVAT